MVTFINFKAEMWSKQLEILLQMLQYFESGPECLPKTKGYLEKVL